MKLSKIIAFLIVTLLATSCATIVSRSIYPVAFTSSPAGAVLTVENRSGRIVYTGATPATIFLDSSAGYMRKERYKVTLTLPGHQTHTTYLSATLNGWYFGNFLIGGLVGFLIVDPATGALYRLPDGLHTVFPNADGGSSSDRGLQILDKNNLPEGVKSEWLVPLKP
jgi:hypothetical protein